MHPSRSSIPEQATLSLAAGDQEGNNGNPQIRIQQHGQWWHAPLCSYNISTLSAALVASLLLEAIQDSGHCLQSPTWHRAKLFEGLSVLPIVSTHLLQSSKVSRNEVFFFLVFFLQLQDPLFWINWILTHWLLQELTDRVVTWDWYCGLRESDWTKIIQPAFMILSLGF